MFGIGEKKETIKSGDKGEEKGEEDEIQFDFEENDKLPFDDDEGFADEDFVDEPARKGLRQSLSQRTLLLILLLLLALGGGGYYYLNSTAVPPEVPPPSKPVAVKTKVTVQPETPALTPAVNPSSPAPVTAVPAKSSQQAPAVKEKVAPVAKTEAVASTPAPVAAVAAPSEVKSEIASLPATRQPFTLTVGAFLNQKHQREVEKKIRRLGYTPKVQTTYSMVPMTRLLLGIYDDPAAALARRKELSAQIPGLFSLQQEGKVALYAGSYQSLNQARTIADQLYLRGILVDEETVSLRMPLKRISFGSFASRTAAEKAAKSAVAAGLTVQVVKR
jgi:cell division septation protein DedD